MRRLLSSAVAAAICVAGFAWASASHQSTDTTVQVAVPLDREVAVHAFGAALELTARTSTARGDAVVDGLPRVPSNTFGSVATPVGPALDIHLPADTLATVTPRVTTAGSTALDFVASFDRSNGRWVALPQSFPGSAAVTADLRSSATVRAFRWNPPGLAQRLAHLLLPATPRASAASCGRLPRGVHVIIQNDAKRAPGLSVCVRRVSDGYAYASVRTTGPTAFTLDCCDEGARFLGRTSVRTDGQRAVLHVIQSTEDSYTLNKGLEPDAAAKLRLPLNRPLSIDGAGLDTLMGEVSRLVGELDPSESADMPGLVACTFSWAAPYLAAHAARWCIGAGADPLLRALKFAVGEERVMRALTADGARFDYADVIVQRTSARAWRGPFLGLPTGNDYNSGYGDRRPTGLNNCGTVGCTIFDIHWSTWGGPRARADASAFWLGHAKFMYLGRYEPAVVIAYDLGRCGGRLAYRKMQVYFPEYGQHFDPARRYAGLCGSGYYNSWQVS
jgi:hypothetical protein